MNNKKIKIIAEVAVASALAFVLSFIKLKVNQSYGITLSIIPIYFISMRRGVRAGLTSGFVIGLIRIVTGNFTMLSVLQVVIEYLFAFMCAGLTGLWANKFQKQAKAKNDTKAIFTLSIATLFGTIVEYFVHFVAGVIYWGSYAPEGMSPVLFSAVANSTSGFLTWLTGLVLLIIVYRVQPRIFIPED